MRLWIFLSSLIFSVALHTNAQATDSGQLMTLNGNEPEIERIDGLNEYERRVRRLQSYQSEFDQIRRDSGNPFRQERDWRQLRPLINAAFLDIFNTRVSPYHAQRSNVYPYDIAQIQPRIYTQQQVDVVRIVRDTNFHYTYLVACFTGPNALGNQMQSRPVGCNVEHNGVYYGAQAIEIPSRLDPSTMEALENLSLPARINIALRVQEPIQRHRNNARYPYAMIHCDAGTTPSASLIYYLSDNPLNEQFRRRNIRNIEGVLCCSSCHNLYYRTIDASEWQAPGRKLLEQINN